MAEKDLKVVISAQNNATQAFSQVTSSATQLATAVQASTEKASTAFDQLHAHAALFASLLSTTVISATPAFAAAGEKLSQAQRQLQTAITDSGGVYENYTAAISKAAAAGQQFGLSDVQVTNALQTLVSVTGNTAASLNLMGLAEDLAAAKHMDLASAAQLVGRVFDGNVGILKRYGLAQVDGTSSTEALANLQQRLSGQAEANATELSQFTAESRTSPARSGRRWVRSRVSFRSCRASRSASKPRARPAAYWSICSGRNKPNRQ
jgi:hypothetical protein